MRHHQDSLYQAIQIDGFLYIFDHITHIFARRRFCTAAHHRYNQSDIFSISIIRIDGFAYVYSSAHSPALAHTGCMQWSCIRTLFPCTSIANDSSWFRLKYAYAFGITAQTQPFAFRFSQSILSNAYAPFPICLCVYASVWKWIWNVHFQNSCSCNCISKTRLYLFYLASNIQPKKKNKTKIHSNGVVRFDVSKSRKTRNLFACRDCFQCNIFFRFSFISLLLVLLLSLSPPTTCVLMPYFIIRLLSFQTAINSNAINYVATISMFRFINFDVVVLHATAERER